jgi:hypothetical protein
MGVLRVMNFTARLVSYEPTRTLQEELVIRRKAGAIGDTLLLLQV